MFSVIKLNEVAIFVKNMSQDRLDDDGKLIDPLTKEEMLDTLELIDNMLVVMKYKSLLNKKRNLKKMIKGIIEMHIDSNSITPGGSNNHLND